MALAKRTKNIVINVPSSTQPSVDGSIDKSTISLNVPAINRNNLSSTQLNAEGKLIDKEVGYIGSLKIDGNNPTLELNIKNSVEPKTLKLSGLESGSISFITRLGVENGIWDLSIGVFNPNTEEGCVINSSLDNF